MIKKESYDLGSKIKIVHVLERMNVGGKENGIVNLCNRLDKQNFQLFICCLKDKGGMIERVNDDIKVFNLKLPEGKPIFSPFVLARFFRKLKPDIVHTHAWGGGYFAGVVAAKLAGVPVVINGEHGRYGKKFFQKIVQAILARLCDGVLSVSESLKDEVSLRVGIPLNKITVIPNGVDTDKFNKILDADIVKKHFSSEPNLTIREDDFVIGHVGSLKPPKNQILLLEACKDLIRGMPNANIKVVLVGDGQDRQVLQSFVKDNGLESKIFFLGIRSDLSFIYSIFDVFVLTSFSNHEGMPNVILEAMASCVPVISTISLGGRELIREGENGFLIQPEDKNSLVSRIKLLYEDRELKRQMGLRARKFVVENYAISKMVKNYENFYISSLKRAGYQFKENC